MSDLPPPVGATTSTRPAPVEERVDGLALPGPELLEPERGAKDVGQRVGGHLGSVPRILAAAQPSASWVVTTEAGGLCPTGS